MFGEGWVGDVGCLGLTIKKRCGAKGPIAAGGVGLLVEDHSIMAAADSAVVLLELDVQWD